MSVKFRGRVFSSSLDSGIKVILEDVKDVESIEIGRLAVIEGSGKLYLCIVDSLEYSVDRDVERLYSELEDTRFIDSFIKIFFIFKKCFFKLFQLFYSEIIR